MARRVSAMRVALGLEYHGAGFCGWQTQPSGCGIQDHLQRALSRIADHPVETVCAGRTDRGVHALAQVVHFDTSAERPLSAWVRGVNSCLPTGVAVNWARTVGPQFHARYGARERCYHYLLLNRPEPPGVYQGRVGWCSRPLDIKAMRQAASLLLGVRDFSAFRAAECQARTPVRELRQLEMAQHGSLVVFRFVADAFLHHMVRNMVGCLVWVGTGKRPPGWAGELLEGRERSQGGPTFGSEGLYLSGVRYAAEWELPEPELSPVFLC